MTNREDSVLSSGLNSDHNVTKKVDGSHSAHSNLKESHKRENKSSKKAGHGSRLSKPTMELYKPPSTKTPEKNGAKVHFQSPVREMPQSSNIGEPKSALKRSKSFTNTERNVISPIFGKDAFPLEYQGLIRNAQLDPNILSSHQLMELVRILCTKAVESSQCAERAAHLCFSIIERETGGTFLESLLNACREWFSERDKLLRPSSCSVAGMQLLGTRRWTAYVSFLTELYMRIKSHHRQSVLSHKSQKATNATGGVNQVSHVSRHELTLLTLLYECSLIILKPPSVNNASEVECLRSMLVTVGKHLENDAPQRMQQLVAALRDAYVNPSVTQQIRKTILELVELHASKWQLDLPQMLYYFPYTSIDRR